MKEQILTITETRQLTPDSYLMALAGDCSEIKRPGQFIDIKIEGFFLRRPISILNWTDSMIYIIFKTVGAGTKKLSELPAGTELSVLMPLGNGFDIAPGMYASRPVLVGGGIGMPPIYGLAKALRKAGTKPIVVLGFNTAQDILPLEGFRSLGIEPVIMTADGSAGHKGFVTEAVKRLDFDYIYACGPLAMLKALRPYIERGQLSLEERMGCGFGACMGCSLKTKHGMKRVCKDGPVFDAQEIEWDEL